MKIAIFFLLRDDGAAVWAVVPPHVYSKKWVVWYNVRMQLLDKKLQKKIKTASKKLGVSEGEVLNRAVSTYLGEMSNAAQLRKELRFWDILSARTMRKHGF